MSAIRSWPEVSAAGLLFLTTAAFVLRQNSQVAVLWDLSYLLDISWRMTLGQIPYRDIPLVHPPLTFLIQSLLIRIAGRHYLFPILYAACIGGMGSILTWRIVLKILRNQIAYARSISLLLTLPLIFLGIHGIYPHPIYDCDCAFAILIALFFLQRMQAEPTQREDLRQTSQSGQWLRPFLAGAATVLPVFFKQNIGLPFLLSVLSGALLLLILTVIPRRTSHEAGTLPDRATLLQFLFAIGIASIAGILLLQATVGLNNYLQWTVRFAAQRRLPGFADMLTVYQQPSFLWTLPTLVCGLLLFHTRFARHLWVRMVALCLASAPFAGSLIFLLLNDDLDERGDNLLALWPLLLLASGIYALIALRKGITLNRLFPFFILAAIHGTFLSQQLWGSTYAIWPLLIILIAYLLTSIPAIWPRSTTAFTSVISVTLLICGSLYATGHERLNYLQTPSEPPHRATLPALRGMATPGPFLPDFEELVQFTQKEIPSQDGIFLLPGEEPFFYATGRTPQFPVQIFDQTTDPYSPAELFQQARNHNIQWVIIKTRLQSNEDPLPERERTMALLQEEFQIYKRVDAYDVYRRR